MQYVLVNSKESNDIRLFAGTVQHTLDDNHRVTVPARWRFEGLSELFAVPDPRQPFLILLPDSELKKIVNDLETAEDVEPQVEKTISLVKPGGRIYWRQNPGLGDHPWKGVEEIQFFPWSMQLNYEWADKYKCIVVECKWDANSDRIYAEWKKSSV